MLENILNWLATLTIAILAAIFVCHIFLKGITGEKLYAFTRKWCKSNQDRVVIHATINESGKKNIYVHGDQNQIGSILYSFCEMNDSFRGVIMLLADYYRDGHRGA